MSSSNYYTTGVPFISTLPVMYWLLPLAAIVVLLFGIAIVSRLTIARRRLGDEETLPLLIDDDEQGNDPQRRGYDSIQNNPATESEQNVGHQVLETRVHPMDTVKFLIPYFWPQNKRFLQLLYVGIGSCLFVERILRMLIPLQLAQITNILTQEPETLPWKQIMLFIGFRALVSKGGLPAARAYLWLPLDKHSYSKISTAAFDKIMSLSSEFHNSRDSASLWESTSRGLSVRYALRSVLFQLIPTFADFAIAAAVLTSAFGVYMALIISVVVIGVFCSTSLILPKQHGKSRRMANGLDKEYRVFCESTSNWRTASGLDRIDLERGQYSSAVIDQTDCSLNFFQWLHFESAVQSLLLILGLLGACLLVAYQIVFEKKPVGNFVMLLGFCVQLSSPLQLFTRELRGVAYRVMNASELLLLFKGQPKVCSPYEPAPGALEVLGTSDVGKHPETYPAGLALPDEEDLKKDIPTKGNRKGSSANTCSTPSTSIWKPEAPEFIPASQRPAPKRSQTVMEQKSAYIPRGDVPRYCPKRYGDQKENIPGMSNSLIEGGSATKVSESGESKPATFAQMLHNSSETNASREFGSVLEPNTNGIVLLSPKKPRKKGKGLKKKQVLRRQLTKSEPAGMGLASF